MNYSVKIPEIFHSSVHNKQIEQCAICGKMLMQANEPYIIEKAFKRNPKQKEDEVIFEYAMCFTCQQSTSKELSKESLKNIKMYFELYVDFEKRQSLLGSPENFQIENCLRNCVITNKLITEYSEYQVGGFFFRDNLLLENLPFALGQTAIEELQELLSEKTRGFLDGFKDKIFPVDIRDKIPDDFLILL